MTSARAICLRLDEEEAALVTDFLMRNASDAATTVN